MSDKEQLEPRENITVSKSVHQLLFDIQTEKRKLGKRVTMRKLADLAITLGIDQMKQEGII